MDWMIAQCEGPSLELRLKGQLSQKQMRTKVVSVVETAEESNPVAG